MTRPSSCYSGNCWYLVVILNLGRGYVGDAQVNLICGAKSVIWSHTNKTRTKFYLIRRSYNLDTILDIKQSSRIFRLKYKLNPRNITEKPACFFHSTCNNPSILCQDGGRPSRGHELISIFMSYRLCTNRDRDWKSVQLKWSCAFDWHFQKRNFARTRKGFLTIYCRIISENGRNIFKVTEFVVCQDVI